MRIGDLARATGLPVATLKYYLREGLLHPGTATAVNQADYDDSHVRRVRLVRALLQHGHLSIADAHRVVAAVDDESVGLHETFGLAQDGMVPARDRTTARYAAARAEVDRFVARHGLQVRADAQVRAMLADALVSAAEYFELPPDQAVATDGLDALMPTMLALADREVATTPDPAPRSRQVEHTVMGTVLFEVAYAAVRRMALEHASARRFGARRRCTT